MDATDTITGSIFAGYKITEKIGQGGMGSVYKARHEAIDKVVCIKLLSPELAREQRNVDFFLREARAAAKLEHPNIVQVHNFGKENGSYFIVMSYVEGKNLLELVTANGPFDTPKATEILLGVLEGLAHAHSKNIIHRDIKPSNILVGNDGVPRLADFGLARSISDEKLLTLAGEMMGTAYFMSPEQGMAGKVDARSDLYCAGATYFYLLTGQYPFEGKNSIAVINKHISEPFPNISLINPDVPLWAADLLEKLMSKKPEDRYQSARELIDDLKKRRDGLWQSPSAESASLTPEALSLTVAKAADAIDAPPPPPPAASTAPAVSMERAQPKASNRSSRTTGTPNTNSARDDKEPGGRPRAQTNSRKMLRYAALTLSAAGCFMVSGASGKEPGNLISPFLHNPLLSVFFAAGGASVIAFAFKYLEKLNLSFHPALFVSAAAAYAAGACVRAPEASGALAKTFTAVQNGLFNAFSGSNSLIYAFFAYLAASKMVFRSSPALKSAAIAAYLCSMFLTYKYFKGGVLPPEKAYLIAAATLALAGILSAAAVKDFSLYFNPPLFFLAANALMFAMFTSPIVSVITDETERAEAQLAAQKNSLATSQYLALARAFESGQQYDVEGRPITRKMLPPPQEIKPPSWNELASRAKKEYYTRIRLKLRSSIADSTGLLLISFFTLLIGNAHFIKELLTADKNHPYGGSQ